jgi:lipopolysaccharide transport system ATP-binding protein
MNEPILKVENLSKRFCRSLKRSLWYGMKDMGGEILLRRKERTKLRRYEFWALKNVSFELHQGETLGLIGANGSGKSTLLKLINGVIKPDTGRISVRGRVGALISLGVGFNPVLTGRENIYVNAAVLGLRRKEVDRLLNQIIDFAEIGDFIDTPVRTYSAGMKVRLGFSIATNIDPDLLLIDEVLAVGDSSFRQRCQERMIEYKKSGGSIIFVSHNSVAVEAISDRVMLLDRGQVLELGEPSQVIEKYESRALELSRQADIRLGYKPATQDGIDIRVTAVQCYDMSGNPKSEFEFGEPFEVRLDYELINDIHLPYFVVAIQKGTRHDPFVSMLATIWDGIRQERIPMQGTVGCVIENPSFSPGSYRIHVGVLAHTSGKLGEKWYMPLRELGSFVVSPGLLRERLPGLPAAHLVSRIPPMVLEHSWKLNEQSISGTRSSLKKG